jgi:hypothetical protein
MEYVEGDRLSDSPQALQVRDIIAASCSSSGSSFTSQHQRSTSVACTTSARGPAPLGFAASLVDFHADEAFEAA